MRKPRQSERRLWFPFYVEHWLTSQDIVLMGPAGEGAYIRLLALAWTQDDCGLPDDDEKLAILSRLGDDWHGRAGKLIREKFRVENGRLYNDRLLDEFAATNERMGLASKAGKASAEARKQRAGERSPNVGATSVERPHNESATQPQPEQNRTNTPPTPSLRPALVVTSLALVDRFHEWMERYPKKVKVDTACQAWISLCDLGEITDANVGEVFDGLDRYLKSEAWAKEGGKYIPDPTSFLTGNKEHRGRMWKDFPPESAESVAATRGAVRSSVGVDPHAEWVPGWGESADNDNESQKEAA